jgi:hypothetical protein
MFLALHSVVLSRNSSQNKILNYEYNNMYVNVTVKH